VVTGVGRLQHVQHFGPPDLADDDAVGAHAKGVANQLAQWHLAPAFDIGRARFQPDDVRAGETQLGDDLGHTSNNLPC
jgi:hypothetical protein